MGFRDYSPDLTNAFRKSVALERVSIPNFDTPFLHWPEESLGRNLGPHLQELQLSTYTYKRLTNLPAWEDHVTRLQNLTRLEGLGRFCLMSWGGRSTGIKSADLSVLQIMRSSGIISPLQVQPRFTKDLQQPILWIPAKPTSSQVKAKYRPTFSETQSILDTRKRQGRSLDREMWLSIDKAKSWSLLFDAGMPWHKLTLHGSPEHFFPSTLKVLKFCWVQHGRSSNALWPALRTLEGLEEFCCNFSLRERSPSNFICDLFVWIESPPIRVPKRSGATLYKRDYSASDYWRVYIEYRLPLIIFPFVSPAVETLYTC